MPDAPPLIAQRRWLPRVRFSLRTLVLGALLAASGFGLWWRWEPWILDERMSREILNEPPKWVLEREDHWLAPDKIRGVSCIDSTIIDVKNGNAPLFCFFEKERITTGIPRGFIDDDTFVFDASTLDEKPILYPTYHRRRPEYWWGVAWLPEFWLTLVFGAALVWSVWRELRRREG